MMEIYGLLPGEFAKLLAAQKGRCPICERKLVSKQLDHCHYSGFARGIIDGRCNRYLAHIEDNPKVGLNLHEYLSNPPAQTILGERVHRDFR